MKSLFDPGHKHTLNSVGDVDTLAYSNTTNLPRPPTGSAREEEHPVFHASHVCQVCAEADA